MKTPAGRLALALAAALALAGCDNMTHQANYRALEPSSYFRNGASARTPPAHTVARGQPAPDDPRATGRDAHGQLLTALPVPVTAALLARGQERFNIYCAVCHGRDGYGRGIVERRGFPSPPSFHQPRLREAPAGHFFDVITHGYGVMYSYADRVAPADRWAIIAYIRALQLSQHATLADVPPEHRQDLTPAVGATGRREQNGGTTSGSSEWPGRSRALPERNILRSQSANIAGP